MASILEATPLKSLARHAEMGFLGFVSLLAVPFLYCHSWQPTRVERLEQFLATVGFLSRT